MQLTQEEIKELENQLSCPDGKLGVEVGKNMNETNIGMTLSTIDFLELEDANSVLELGHGNCGHLQHLLTIANNIDYFGLEVSKTMYEEAQKNNTTKQAKFSLYDGETIPFKDNSFNRVMSVNTIYFWSNPQKLITEIERVLKPNGICILTYANKEFMKNLPFVGDKFQLFGTKEMEALISTSNLKVDEFIHKTEQVTSKAGDSVERTYTLAKIKLHQQ
ncbi:class I SAM-dependent methyltransferase [Tenacibaculum caenipelagi]|uniref:Methyltransferase family protein n=1 Tax=Tenacibaculum caenipelagi TaxID=1325435 RepID=A0A4R6TFM0_9FLAO|nr:class I SAM-dependent methyltransferase [Tenacibaculum caenipelagi]TDQ27570.1 methyltransferase family protein [Tenacibaculum caenipelagi]